MINDDAKQRYYEHCLGMICIKVRHYHWAHR